MAARRLGPWPLWALLEGGRAKAMAPFFGAVALAPGVWRHGCVWTSQMRLPRRGALVWRAVGHGVAIGWGLPIRPLQYSVSATLWFVTGKRTMPSGVGVARSLPVLTGLTENLRGTGTLSKTDLHSRAHATLTVSKECRRVRQPFGRQPLFAHAGARDGCD